MDGILSLSLCLVGGVFYKQAPMKKVDHDHVDVEDGCGGTPSKRRADDDGIELAATPLLESTVQSRPNRGISNNGR